MSPAINGAVPRAGQGEAFSIAAPKAKTATIGSIRRAILALLDTGIPLAPAARLQDGAARDDPHGETEKMIDRWMCGFACDLASQEGMNGRTGGMRGKSYPRQSTAIAALLAFSISGQAKSATLCRDCTANLAPEERRAIGPLPPLNPFTAHERRGQDDYDLFHAIIAGNAIERHRRGVIELVHGTVSFDAGRQYVPRRIWQDAAGQSRDRRSAWGLGLRYRNEIEDFGTVALGITAAMERRRFALDLTEGRWSRSQAIGAEASWMGADRWQLTAGYKISGGSSRADGIRRSIELVQGAPATMRGFRLAIGFTPTGIGAARTSTFGLEMRRSRLSNADTIAFGGRTSSDNRLLATFAAHF